MLNRIKPSPAMAVALLALFVALGGGAYAATNLPANSVGTSQLQNGAVTNSKLAGNSVWHANIGTRSVRNINLAGNSVWHAQIGTGSVQRNNISAQLFSELRGPAGPPGTIASVVIRDNVVSVPAGGSAHGVQSCNAGEVVVGGQARPTTDGDASLQVITSRAAGDSAGSSPADGKPLFGWFGSASNTGRAADTMVVSAFCGQP